MVKKPEEARPYHHGDLRRALITAAERILEREGPNALSLRAVAREAGVSAAAPYHHFKDKDELLAAVAHTGFEKLAEAMAKASDQVDDPYKRVNAIGVAYVCFARDNRALYHLMYDSSRRENFRAEPRKSGEGPTSVTLKALAKAGGEEVDPLQLELRQVAGWCMTHGLAEMEASR
ncbi:MAG: TetR/AcrR family transcriptional regulator, partial [Alphaproteobacteria bacterium]